MEMSGVSPEGSLLTQRTMECCLISFRRTLYIALSTRIKFSRRRLSFLASVWQDCIGAVFPYFGCRSSWVFYHILVVIGELLSPQSFRQLTPSYVTQSVQYHRAVYLLVSLCLMQPQQEEKAQPTPHH
jgi:hypothetical protein